MQREIFMADRQLRRTERLQTDPRLQAIIPQEQTLRLLMTMSPGPR